jgi:hypothetical protein
MINTLENNFFYIAAVISLSCMALFIYFIHLNITLKNKDEAPHLSKSAIILASLYEVITIIVAAVIVKNVIINVYDYLFLLTILLLGITEILYVIKYNKAKKAYLIK